MPPTPRQLLFQRLRALTCVQHFHSPRRIRPVIFFACFYGQPWLYFIRLLPPEPYVFSSQWQMTLQRRSPSCPSIGSQLCVLESNDLVRVPGKFMIRIRNTILNWDILRVLR
ncbi:hypothetical protein LY78DRAFT_92620 [Colletotrichum sublineola]|nr:hypothetical protein LY78DRAFT_92620 [Colletotrichum sublineola]